MSRYRKEVFPISIFHGGVEDNNKLKELIIPFVENTKNDRNNEIPNGWLTNDLTTSFNNGEVNKVLLDDNHEIGRELRGQYFNVLNQFFDDNFEVKLQGMWYNLYRNGEWQEAHTHLGGLAPIHFACIHFLSFNPQIHTPVCFLDPLVTQRALSLEMQSNRYSEKYRPRVKEGDFLMFPSYLPHEVSPSAATPDYPRITLSFNIEVLKYGSEEENREN